MVVEVAQRHLENDEWFFALGLGLVSELYKRTLEHVDRYAGGWPEAAAFDQHRPFVKQLRRLHDLAVGLEHRRLGQSMLDELQAHQTVVDPLECRAVEPDHVDLNPLGGQLVQERKDQRFRFAEEQHRPVDEVDPDDAQRLLLLHVLRVEHAQVQNDLGRLGLGLVLKADAHPAVRLVVALVAPGLDRVGEAEKTGVASALRGESLDEQIELSAHHGLQPQLADVTLGFAVYDIADRHVIGRHGLGDGAGGAAYLEEPSGHLLPSADLGESAVKLFVQVDSEGFLSCRRARVFVRHRPIRGTLCPSQAEKSLLETEKTQYLNLVRIEADDAVEVITI